MGREIWSLIRKGFFSACLISAVLYYNSANKSEEQESDLFQERRALKILREVAKKAGYKERINLVIGPNSYRRIAETNREKGIIQIRFFRSSLFMSDTAIRGVMAHELGHVMCGNIDDNFYVELEHFNEIDAESFAIDLVGEEDFKICYREKGFDVNALPLFFKKIKERSVCHWHADQ